VRLKPTCTESWLTAKEAWTSQQWQRIESKAFGPSSQTSSDGLSDPESHAALLRRPRQEGQASVGIAKRASWSFAS